ncbi:MAG: ATPase, T2SS/T4P/T4SS family [archaeon]
MKKKLIKKTTERKEIERVKPEPIKVTIKKSEKSEKPELKQVNASDNKILEAYTVDYEGVKTSVSIIENHKEFVLLYYLNYPDYGVGTKALISSLKQNIISKANIGSERLMDLRLVETLKQQFKQKAIELLDIELPELLPEYKNELVAILLQEMLGLGKIELLLKDSNLEEIVINSVEEPLWVYHKKFGWLKTNIILPTEGETQNYASIIARRVGKQITTLNPLLDAHLVTGDRANATLFPISTDGNTITIRRFRRDPWTVTDFIKNKTTSSDMMAMIWMSMALEQNILVSGGTGSGKTSFLNVCMPFIQPNHRVLSLEDTREIQLPDFLHWVPLVTRAPNPEGKGEISMLDLLVNSLRMRPDRIVVGEVRRQREAEVLFEAMHTGHSVYTTIHANTADETIRRITHAPISISPSMLDAVNLNVVMFRNRRLGTRRILQIAEFIPEKRGGEEVIKPNVLFRWEPASDSIVKYAEPIRFYDELALHTGLTRNEITKEIDEKKSVLDWMVKQNIRNVNEVGKTMALYYRYKQEVLDLVKKDSKPNYLT